MKTSIPLLALLLLAFTALADLPRPTITAKTRTRGRVDIKFQVLDADGVVQIERSIAENRDCRWTLIPMQLSRSQMNGQPEFCTFTDTNIVFNCEYSYRLRWLKGTEKSAWSDKVWVKQGL